jgi:hypothetical protein
MGGSTDNGLPIPTKVLADPKSMEILRAWVADKGLHCSLRPELWDDAGSWGIALADVARHAANAIEESKGIPSSQTLERIRAAFAAEMGSPTDEPSGGFVE